MAARDECRQKGVHVSSDECYSQRACHLLQKNTPEQQIGDARVVLNDNDGDMTHSVTEHALLTLSSLQAAVSVYVLFYSHCLFTGRRCTSHSY